MDGVARKAWIKPSLTPHSSGADNMFGMGYPGNYRSTIDGVVIEELLEKFGSPLFVLSEKQLRENARQLLRSFRTRYPRVRYGWSYKTNYLNAVCSILHQEGAWAEVVSNFEYEKARALDVPGSRIIFNGPYKQPAILERAVNEGALIHLDNLDEMFQLEAIATRLNRRVPCALRLNFNTGYTEAWSRFGFNIETGAAADAARRIAASGALELTGLHSHIGTFVLDPRAYASQVKIMCEFMDFAESQTATPIQYIDIGGGFASRNALQGIYLPPEQVVPTIDQYATAITEALLGAVRNRKEWPWLILETGRAVVDDAESLVSTVVGSKRLPDGRRSLILDAGVNLLFTSYWYHHSCQPVRPIGGALEETVLYGPLCMNIDVMRHSVWLPPLRNGDAVVFNPVGAYNNTQWQEFIQYRPAIVLVHASGGVSVVRNRDTLETMMAQERLPASLATPFPQGLPE
jgi:diaminopimelate decarboxylase